MSKAILDASALLALLKREPGSDQVAQALADGAVICAVNLSEVVAKLADGGMPELFIHRTLDALDVEVVAFETQLAYQAGLLRSSTRQFGLSLGDRSCLALAVSRSLPVLTTDQAWLQLAIGVTVHAIR